ncbi:MAG: SUMF1/EgtB/PvdO family nonheme iron enzyme [Bauldia sp.]
MLRRFGNAAAALLGLVIVAFAAAVALAPAAYAEKRIALVIGNSAYKTVGLLANPKNDADLIARSLTATGFEVTKVIDADQRTMKQAIADFGRKLRDGVDTSLFYYAGHGIQAAGKNYLIPVDAALNDEFDLDVQALDVNAFLGVMQGSSAKINIVILDACRNNPYARSFRSATRGLAMVDAPRGTYIAYSTAPGDVAQDGTGDNSPYASALAQAMVKPGLRIEDTFKETRRAVLEQTSNKQVPWELGSINGDFYFQGGPGVQVAAVAAPGAIAVTGGIPSPGLGPGGVSVEQIAVDYQAAERVGTTAAWDIFLNRYQDANSFYVQLAREARQKVALLTPPTQPLPNGTRPVAPPVAGCPGGVVAAVGAAAAVPGGDRCLRPKEIFTDCAPTCPEMVVLPVGTFTMGSPANEAARAEDEGPAHPVAVATPIAVGRYEVTRAQYAAFVAETNYRVAPTCRVLGAAGNAFAEAINKSFRDPGYRQEDNHPAVCISYEDARAYAAWLTRKTGKTYRLLSESEWEYAARAGTTTPYWFGQDVSRICGFANGADQTGKAQFAAWVAVGCRDGYTFTAPVGSYSPNEFGLYDMSGNVAEWTEDCYRNSYLGAAREAVAWQGTGTCQTRVLRGGSWYSLQKALRSADRDGTAPTVRYANVGFRVARVLAQ